MTVRDGVGVIRERWILVLAILVTAIGGAVAVWLVRPAAYTATIGFYVSAQNTDNTQSAYQGGLLSQERVKSYVELIESARVAQEVIADIGRPNSTPEEVAKQITASSESDSVIINVAVTDPTARRAAAIANSIGRRFTALVDEFERPSRPGTVAPVAVHVIRPAPVPTAPSTPGLPTMLVFGLLVGIALGIAAALTRNLLDVSVKSLDQLRGLTSAPNLGTTAYDAAVRVRPLTVQESPQSPRAEAFRQLRTNLRFLDVDGAHRIVALTSPMPHEGKTTTVLNLAAAIAAGGQRVLVVDADLRRPSAARLLGLEGGIGLTSVLCGRCEAGSAIQPWAERADLLASGPIPPNPSELLASQHLRRVLQELRQHYDIVLVDTPPVLPVTDAAALAPLTDGIILAIRHRSTTAEQVRSAVDAIDAVHVPVLGTVLTMVPTRGPSSYGQYNDVYSARRPSPLKAPNAASSPTSTLAPVEQAGPDVWLRRHSWYGSAVTVETKAVSPRATSHAAPLGPVNRARTKTHAAERNGAAHHGIAARGDHR